MAYFDFNPFGTESIIVRFKCNQCLNQVESEEISVPAPDYSAERTSDSQSENEGVAVCGECEKEFDINIFVTYVGGDGDIEDLPDGYDIQIEEIEELYYNEQFEAIAANTAYFETLNKGLDSILELLKIEPISEELKQLFRRQLYSSVIGIMETYLSDAFINTVFKSKENLKKFYKTFDGFKNDKIHVSTIYDFVSNAENNAKKALLDVTYHNLAKVSKMYEDTFGIIFPESSDIYKAIANRHDFVHRNGKDKEGCEVFLTFSMIVELVDKIKLFISMIDIEIRQKQSHELESSNENISLN